MAPSHELIAARRSVASFPYLAANSRFRSPIARSNSRAFPRRSSLGFGSPRTKGCHASSQAAARPIVFRRARNSGPIPKRKIPALSAARTRSRASQIAVAPSPCGARSARIVLCVGTGPAVLRWRSHGEPVLDHFAWDEVVATLANAFHARTLRHHRTNSMQTSLGI